MFIVFLFHIVFSMYPVFYKEDQPNIILGKDLAAELRLDELLSQFLSRESDCPNFDKNQCFEDYIDASGNEAQLKLQKEEFDVYDIDTQEKEKEVIIYKNQALDPEDHLSTVNFVALGPLQSHTNTLYQSGFRFCLSSIDGYLEPDYNQNIHDDQSVLALTGVVSPLNQNQYTTYLFRVSMMQFFDRVAEISLNHVAIVQDNWISLPTKLFSEFIRNHQAGNEFKYDSQDDAYFRPYDKHRNENFTPILFYNEKNNDNPLIVLPEQYIEYNYQNSGQDLLRIISNTEKDLIILGMPFLKNKNIIVQTEQRYLYIQQLNDDKCIPESDSLGAGAIIFIISQIILLPLLVYCTFKKLRENKEAKAARGYQNAQLVTELQHQQM